MAFGVETCEGHADGLGDEDEGGGGVGGFEGGDDDVVEEGVELGGGEVEVV